MKKTTIMFAVVGMLSALQSQAALTFTFHDYANPALTGEGGGPFSATLNGSDTFNGVTLNAKELTYTTFCIEDNEYINFGATYDAKLNSGSINGGVGGQDPAGGSFDPLSQGTTYLYSLWAADKIDKTFGPELQQAIWALEDEKTDSSYLLQSSKMADLLRSQFGDLSDLSIWKKTAPIGAYGVYALNLKTLDGGLAQDQLVAVPEPNTLIAGALVLLPFPLSMVRSFRRKS
jgi:hypothetical protein